MANKIVLVGWVHNDPQFTNNQAGNPLLKFILRELHKWSGKQKELKVKEVLHSVHMWGPMATSLINNIQKGDVVLVDGMLEYFERSQRESTISNAQVNARNIEILCRPESFE